MMRLACVFERSNPFAKAKASQALLFNKHTGSEEWWNELSRKGENANVESFIAKWATTAAAFKKTSKKFHIYSA